MKTKTSKQSTSVRILPLLAALAAGLAGSAHADGITMYGLADIYGEYGKGDRNEVSVNSGGLSGTRLGFDAAKDLGGGLKAVGKLEAGVGIDTGSSNQGGLIFGRQAYAGVTGSFGQLTAGRQYTPQFIALDSNDPFDAGAGSAASSGIISLYVGGRANNSIEWFSPTMGDFSVMAMVAAGESSSGSQTNGSLAQVDLHFGKGASGADITVSGLKKATDSGVNSSAVTLSGTYDFGVVKLMGGVQFVNNSTGLPDTPDNRREAFAGVRVPVGADQIWIGAGASRTQSVANTTASQYSLGYLHPISKGFDVYGVLSSISNGDATAYSTDTATAAGPAVSDGKTASSLQVGFRYVF